MFIYIHNEYTGIGVQLKLHMSMDAQCLLCGVYVMTVAQPLEAIVECKV